MPGLDALFVRHLRSSRAGWGTFDRYTKRPLQDSAIIFSTRGMGESAFYCKSQGFLQISATPRVENPQIFRWKMPFTVFRSGSAVSDWAGPKTPNGIAQNRCPNGVLVPPH